MDFIAGSSQFLGIGQWRTALAATLTHRGTHLSVRPSIRASFRRPEKGLRTLRLPDVKPPCYTDPGILGFPGFFCPSKGGVGWASRQATYAATDRPLSAISRLGSRVSAKVAWR